MLTPELFDHTILKQDATEKEVEKVCLEAKAHQFASVCVNGYYTSYAARLLQGSPVKVCTVIGFPLGQMSAKAKCMETELAVADGAAEIDMVLNAGALKDGKYQEIEEEIRQVKKSCGQALLKVILETCLLSAAEIQKACELSAAAGADFVKTSTGFQAGGATPEHVALMRKTVGGTMGVKAAGGIRSRETAIAMVKAGANRLGTSATVAIYEGVSAGADTKV